MRVLIGKKIDKSIAVIMSYQTKQEERRNLMRKNTVDMAILIMAVCFLTACAGGKLAVEPVGPSENPIEQVNRLESDIKAARKERLNVLAPIWFGKAEASLNDAKGALERGDELSRILGKVADGRAQLQRAEQKSELVKTALKDAIEARERARAAGAVRLRDDYDTAERQFLRLSRAIEKNDLKYAQKNSPKVIKAFDELELRAIKGEALGEARNLINQAETAGAEKTSPETLATAQKTLLEADIFISENRYQKEEIREKADEALFQARRLIQVMEQTKQIRKSEPEQIALWVEDMLHKTANKLSMPDMRDKEFKTQHKNILSSIGELRYDYGSALNKLDAQQEELEGMEHQIGVLEGRTREEQVAKERLAEQEQAVKERLAAERRFHQLFNEVRRQFGPTEAEVYKQGNALVIRLKSIQFPVGKAVIMPSNYAVLSKVQEAIRIFGEPDVVIEGHTDSTGSDAVNERLSQERADAVREYFVANGTLSYEGIYAIGYGSARPLASNETAEGRAINRRIDVIITPKAPTG